MKNLVLSLLLGITSTYLPFWEWDGDIATQFICGFSIFVLIYGWVEFTDGRKKHGRHE